MTQVNRLSVPFLLAFLMVMLPLSQVDFSEELSQDVIQEIEVANSASNQLNLTEPYHPKTFVDDAKFFDSVRAESVSVGFRSS